MLTLFGRKQRYCDGITRRGFLQIGGFTFGSTCLGLPQILRAEAGAGSASSHKAVINIFLGGGPPHQDMWEIKTDAPREIRGEFNPIDTAVPGIQIGECFPRIAAMMDKFVAIRSVVGCDGAHDGFQCLTGLAPTGSGDDRRPAEHRFGGLEASRPGRIAAYRPRWPSLRRPSTRRGRNRAVPASSARPISRSSRMARAWTT